MLERFKALVFFIIQEDDRFTAFQCQGDFRQGYHASWGCNHHVTGQSIDSVSGVSNSGEDGYADVFGSISRIASR